ncbi:MAG: TM0106 family RecB-like putative nuclease [Solirubrobacterales bacterium]|nr:TM0106 family RecB-like putative nuclease [Solirubrobacterales bacterium]
MQILGERRIVSASDLNDRLACRHLLFLNLQRALGELEEGPGQSATGALLARKGDEHESAYLESLKAEGRQVVELSGPDDYGIEALEAAAAETAEAMKAGPDVIFQATFFDGERRGHTDFLFRVDRPSDLGDFSYEVADTKLARSSKPYFIVQLCFYSELLQKVQGGEAPDHIHVILGNREQKTYRLSDFASYYRQLSSAFDADFAAGVPGTSPYPVAHCDICGWKDKCSRELDEADHLSRVAGIRRDQVEALELAGISTVHALAELDPATEVEDLRKDALEKLQAQASLQVDSEDGKPKYELLEPQGERGFERLPEPSDGDIFFDFEGDPLYGDSGLEYLFGWVEIDIGEQEFKYIWAKDSAKERQAFEDFIDFVGERRKTWPDLHIYHYAPYEVTALKRLAATYSTREFELDELLRGKVFVDLYKVVKESLRLGQDSYSIKKVEAYYRPEQDGRDTAVADGGDSIIQFEEWLETGDDSIKEAILEYNADDCASTVECRDWLLERRDEAAERFGVEFPWFLADFETEGQDERLETNADVRQELDADVPDLASDRTPEQQARWLMGRLVDYHQREARPAWWEYFDRLDYSDPDDFLDDQEAIGGLHEDPETPPWPVKQSTAHRMLFPTQESKLGPGSYIDPDIEKSGGEILEIDLAEGWLILKRGNRSLAGVPLPHALISGGPYTTPEQRKAIRRLADDIVERGLESTDQYLACRDILLRRPPRIEGISAGDALLADSANLDELSDLVDRMDSSCLFIQGPPGAGKTYSGSRVIVDLIAADKRIGVAATSHKAINNLLSGIEEAAVEKSITLRGMKKGKDDKEFRSELPVAMIGNSNDNPALNDPDLDLVAGTAWYFCREDTRPVDYLFIDEAGQISLADALAMGTSAKNIVLLGDPQQLAQVSRARHPDGSGVSVLEHLLGPDQTIPGDRGVFLDNTWRMHPDVTSFISGLMYEGRLHSAPGREKQRINSSGHLVGTGLNWIPVEHQNRSRRCPEEAEMVDELFRELTDGSATYVDFDGQEHPVGVDDILIVSPYNAQVRQLIETLPEGARVGTVDKFQGQEAQAVIFSMATSSGEDIPRNIEFLFSRNRLNVATSRARCLAAVVASPRLLEVEARSVDQMRLINALCLFAEMAESA